MSFWLKGVLDVSGAATSGSNGVKGLIKSRNRRPLIVTVAPLCGLSTFQKKWCNVEQCFFAARKATYGRAKPYGKERTF